MKRLLLCLLFATSAHAVNGPCPQTSGALTTTPTSPRVSGISPLLVFFDNSGVASTNVTTNMTAFQDVNSTWDSGDTLGSGTSTWTYGSNAGHNLKRYGTGNIFAHLYVTEGRDTKYTATVTSSDGVNQISCGVGITVFDPSGANGWPGAATTCFFNTTVGSGCPAGATQTVASTFAATNGNLANKRLLYKCGDTFTGDNNTITGVKWSVGAYGGCEGTQTNRPIFNDTVTNCQIEIGPNAGDGRISDIAFRGNGTAKCAVETIAFVTQNIPYQITMWNLSSTGNASNYSWFQGAQWGLIGSAASDARGISVFVNSEGANPTQQIGTFPNVDYQSVMGNFINGVGLAGGGGTGVEAFRTAYCRKCYYANNTMQNANGTPTLAGGGVFKFHQANTFNSVATWVGVYTEFDEISDNLIQGNCGGVLSDAPSPEQGGDDERLRNIVLERNVYNSTTNGGGDTLVLADGQNLTFRDNAFYMPAQSSTLYAGSGLAIIQRGSGSIFPVQFNEAYNNVCYAPNHEPNQQCVAFDTCCAASAATTNSIAKNNLFYVPVTATGLAVHSTGAGNIVSNNTVTVTNNAGFVNAGGSFALLTDFKPTANFTGGVSVPVKYDGTLSSTNPYGITWSPTWDLGAVHH